MDERSGGIRHTIIIVPATPGMKPPILRVAPKHVITGVPLRSLFTPVGMWRLPRGGDVTASEEAGTKLNTGQVELKYHQVYGMNAPHPGPSLSLSLSLQILTEFLDRSEEDQHSKRVHPHQLYGNVLDVCELFRNSDDHRMVLPRHSHL